MTSMLMSFVMSFYMAGPFTSLKNWVLEEAQAAVAVVAIVVVIVLAAKRQISAMITWIIIIGLVVVIVFSFDSFATWIQALFKTMLGIK